METLKMTARAGKGEFIMNKDLENIEQAKKSFDHILNNKKYAAIIKDDKHLSILMHLLENSNFQKILDIGTGTGYLAFPLAEKFSESTIYGIDIAETTIEKNNKLAKEKGFSNLTFQSFDGLKYPFSKESFDLIVTRYAFHHFPNIMDAVCQMNSLLVKGGKVLISDPMKNEKDTNGIIDEYMKVKKDGHIHFYSKNELDELFLHNGFTKEKQIFNNMKFPFAPIPEYIEIYNKTSEEDKLLYAIENENNIIWIKQINVGNTIFVKM